MSLLMTLPQPRKLDGIPRDLLDLATRTRIFSEDVFENHRLQRLEAARIEAAIVALQNAGGGGGGPVSFGSPVALTVGGGNVDGVSSLAARAEHKHALPDFGSPDALTVGGGNVDGASGTFADAEHKHSLPPFGAGAGEFCEGNDARLIDTASYCSKYDVDAPPEVPHAGDDECLGVVIDPGWTVWDSGIYGTFSADPDRKQYEMNGIGNGSTRWMGLYKANPTVGPPWTMYARLSLAMTGTAIGAARIGIMVGDFTTPATGDFRTIYRSYLPGTSAFGACLAETYTSFASGVANQSSVQNVCAHYLRIRALGTTIETDWSEDGLTWHTLGILGVGFAVLHVGVCFRVDTNLTRGWGRIHFVRFVDGTADFNGQLPGRLIKVPTA